MTAPAAPLEKAVEALARWDKRADPHPEGAGLAVALRLLLAALDADDRLAKAEKVLKEISAYCCKYETMGYDRDCAALFEPGTVTCYSCRARRYFAAKGERP